MKPEDRKSMIQVGAYKNGVRTKLYVCLGVKHSGLAAIHVLAFFGEILVLELSFKEHITIQMKIKKVQVVRLVTQKGNRLSLEPLFIFFKEKQNIQASSLGVSTHIKQFERFHGLVNYHRPTSL